MAHSSLRLKSLGAPLAQHLNRRVAVNQFAAFGLSKAFLEVGGDAFALFEHPVFEIQLVADNLKGLIENLLGVPIHAGPDRQVDDALLFRFKIDRHWAFPSISNLLMAVSSWEPRQRLCAVPTPAP
jgi:hypothetical protein